MRIWFNHWFSTAYHLIGLMRRDAPEPLTVIGSNSSDKAVYRQVCDEWAGEEELPEEEYTAFRLRFCEEHRVDVFVPRRGLVGIVREMERFRALGVRVMAEPDAALVSLLDDKLRTYAYFREVLPEIVPECRVADSLDAFREACGTMRASSGRLCYKLSIDEGAKSFRVIDDSIESLQALRTKPGSKITRRAAELVLASYDFSVPLMVMPYLSGADVSVDCMETPQGPLVIPRFKVGRYSEVKPDPEVTRLCLMIMERLHFTMPANIQFKMEQGRPWLMEINPRMSGGLQLSCLATGINVPGIALRKLTGYPAAWAYPEPWEKSGLLNLETPVIVSR